MVHAPGRINSPCPCRLCTELRVAGVPHIMEGRSLSDRLVYDQGVSIKRAAPTPDASTYSPDKGAGLALAQSCVKARSNDAINGPIK